MFNIITASERYAHLVVEHDFNVLRLDSWSLAIFSKITCLVGLPSMKKYKN